MSIFTDTVTIYHKDGNAWSRFVINGVQWSDHYDKSVATGRLTVDRYATITFPRQTIVNDILTLDEDAIFYGEITDECADVKGMRVSDLLKKYQRGGLVQSINDNTNRPLLPNTKVIVK